MVALEYKDKGHGTYSNGLCGLESQAIRKNVLFPCDNSSVVVSINKGSARQDVVMHLLHNMWFLQLIRTCLCQQLTYRGSKSYCRLYFQG